MRRPGCTPTLLSRRQLPVCAPMTVPCVLQDGTKYTFWAYATVGVLRKCKSEAFVTTTPTCIPGATSLPAWQLDAAARARAALPAIVGVEATPCGPLTVQIAPPASAGGAGGWWVGAKCHASLADANCLW